MDLKLTNIPNNTKTRKLVDLDQPTGNIYKSLNIISRRANQIAAEMKQELNRKLADFSSSSESLEISRYYERLPKPSIIATEEFLAGKLYYRDNKDEE